MNRLSLVEAPRSDEERRKYRTRRVAAAALVGLGFAVPTVTVGAFWAVGHSGKPALVDCETAAIPDGETTDDTIMDMMAAVDGTQSPEAAHKLAARIGEHEPGTILKACGSEALSLVTAVAFEKDGTPINPNIAPTVTFSGAETFEKIPGDPLGLLQH